MTYQQVPQEIYEVHGYTIVCEPGVSILDFWREAMNYLVSLGGGIDAMLVTKESELILRKELKGKFLH